MPSEAFLSASHSQECLIPDSCDSCQWGSVLYMEAFPLVIRWNAVWFSHTVILFRSLPLPLHIIDAPYFSPPTTLLNALDLGEPV